MPFCSFNLNIASTLSSVLSSSLTFKEGGNESTVTPFQILSVTEAQPAVPATLPSTLLLATHSALILSPLLSEDIVSEGNPSSLFNIYLFPPSPLGLSTNLQSAVVSIT